MYMNTCNCWMSGCPFIEVIFSYIVAPICRSSRQLLKKYSDDDEINCFYLKFTFLNSCGRD